MYFVFLFQSIDQSLPSRLHVNNSGEHMSKHATFVEFLCLPHGAERPCVDIGCRGNRRRKSGSGIDPGKGKTLNPYWFRELNVFPGKMFRSIVYSHPRDVFCFESASKLSWKGLLWLERKRLRLKYPDFNQDEDEAECAKMISVYHSNPPGAAAAALPAEDSPPCPPPPAPSPPPRASSAAETKECLEQPQASA
ncbi:hypothetical protein CEXT_592271 [Caerostris extrusa]|uniref:Uncharacterized protein n=1 Tax=Caerostris extrusa TaxID=172846 RepID=A0AAV4VU88_CAEEX|nr:hypothetical protein CEXT_592271 [Caerostris extrusa]